MSKSFCFTLNNYTDKDIIKFNNLECNYLIYGKEIGKNGTKHLQGYITFKRSKRIKGLKKICSRTHWEHLKGDEESAINYCKKEGDITVIDNRHQGARTDLKETIKEILDQKSWREVMLNIDIRRHFNWSKEIWALKKAEFKLDKLKTW